MKNKLKLTNVGVVDVVVVVARCLSARVFPRPLCDPWRLGQMVAIRKLNQVGMAQIVRWRMHELKTKEKTNRVNAMNNKDKVFHQGRSGLSTWKYQFSYDH